MDKLAILLKGLVAIIIEIGEWGSRFGPGMVQI